MINARCCPEAPTRRCECGASSTRTPTHSRPSRAPPSYKLQHKNRDGKTSLYVFQPRLTHTNSPHIKCLLSRFSKVNSHTNRLKHKDTDTFETCPCVPSVCHIYKLERKERDGQTNLCVFPPRLTHKDTETLETFPLSSATNHPGGNPGANPKSMSHICYLRGVAFEWELTKETIFLPMSCLQSGFVIC